MIPTGKKTRNPLRVIVAILYVLSTSTTKGETLWPLPRHMSLSGSPYPISKALCFSTLSKSNILQRGITRYLSYITTHLLPNDESGVYEDELEIVVLNVANDDETLGMNTSYKYEIYFRSSNTLYINAQSPFGALYGLETFSQLIEHGDLIHQFVTISDEPTYIHRGLLVDTGRRIFPLELLYNTLDAMSFVKMNVLHFHLTDFGRFSVESKLYPDLRNNESEIYTQDDIKSLIAYARDRGIRVVPEVEAAGHANGMLGLSDKTHGLVFCNFSGYIQLYNDPQQITLRTMKGILSEMMSLFPDELFHLGLDEIFDDKNSSSVTAPWKDLKALETALLHHVARNKTTVAWEEALSRTKNALTSTVIQAWKGESIKTIVGKKHGAINSLARNFYLDIETVTPTKLWTDISSGLNQKESKFLLGGEMAMWTDEYCHIFECYDQMRKKPKAWWMYDSAYSAQFTQSISGLIWPRAAAGAGSFWNYDKDLKADSANFKLRYKSVNKRLLERGILACPVECKCDYLTRCGKPYRQQFNTKTGPPLFMK